LNRYRRVGTSSFRGCDADVGLADRFGKFYDAKRIYNSYDEMLADPEVDAIIIGISDAFTSQPRCRRCPLVSMYSARSRLG
jgi:hypothetical protein